MGENDGTQVPETVTVPKEQYDEMVEKLADKTQATTNLVAEIKELREKSQLTATEAEELRKKLEQRDIQNDGGVEPAKFAEIAEQAAKKVLSERDQEVAKDNRKTAFEAFVAKHKEFHPDNDEGGLKLSSLEGKLKRFSLSGLKTQDDFMSVFEDARSLTVGGGSSEERTDNPNPLPPNGGGNSTREVIENDLTSKEMRIIDDTFGGDKERYLKIKTKRPEYVASLLQYSL